jgi:hypothetical protein
MAVYPNKIVLKDTTDATVDALAAISFETEDITFGEIVVNRVSDEVFLLTKYNYGLGKVISAPAPLGDRGSITVTNSGYTWIINDGSVTDIKIAGPISIANGGTGQSTANAGLNALLPSQAGATGKALFTDGTNTYWDTAAGGGGSSLPINGTINDILKWDGASWISAGLSTFSIDQLGDVDTTTNALSINNILKWNGTSWIGTSLSLSELSDVNITSYIPTINDILKWDGTSWISAGFSTFSIDQLGDVDTTTVAPVTNDILKWDGALWRSASFSTFSIGQLSDVNTTTVVPTRNQSLTWNGTAWAPGNPATLIGRGDGGDYDNAIVGSAFIFGVWGGGDFDIDGGEDGGDFSNGSVASYIGDLPIELLVPSIVDGGEVTTTYISVFIPAPRIIAITAGSPIVTIGTAIIVTSTTMILNAQTDIMAGHIPYIIISSPIELTLNVSGSPSIQTGPVDNYFSSFVAQTYGWENNILIDWWAT